MRYRYYKANNKIICVSSYAGKPVRGVASCAPEDEFDVDKGKAIAKARCDVKVAEKRVKNAYDKYDEAVAVATKTRARVDKMSNYLTDSANALKKADQILEELIKNA